MIKIAKGINLDYMQPSIVGCFLIIPKAVEAAEAAVAVVQTRLMEALRSKADLVAEVSRVKLTAEVDMSRLEAEVRG